MHMQSVLSSTKKARLRFMLVPFPDSFAVCIDRVGNLVSVKLTVKVLSSAEFSAVMS